MISKKLAAALRKFKLSIDYRVENFDSQIVAFGVICLLLFQLFYFVCKYILLQKYNNIIWFLIGATICIPLIFKNHWPRKLQPYLSIYWYTCLVYCLPFFTSFMLLKNNASDFYLMATTTALFWLILLVDRLSYIIILTLGVGLALLFYYFPAHSWVPVNFRGLFPVYLAELLIIAIFATNKDRLEKAKLQAVSAVGASIAHELRTPLATVSSGIKGIKMYLPNLIEAYQQARNLSLPIKEIPPNHYKNLLKALDNISTETHYASSIVNMLLIKINRTKISPSTFQTCSIAHCIELALNRYPFNSEKQRQLIYWHGDEDFLFQGTELLVVHVLFNLLKNALYFIEVAGKGEIHIWLERGAKINKLHFKDTATGIASCFMPRLFNRFFTTSHNGTGLGLAFCKMVMNGFNGEINCYSQYGVYTNFVLSFPNNPGLQHQANNSIFAEEL